MTKLLKILKLFLLLTSILQDNCVAVPIILTKDNYIIDGHTRIKAARAFGIKQIPAVRIDAKVEKVNIEDIRNSY